MFSSFFLLFPSMFANVHFGLSGSLFVESLQGHLHAFPYIFFQKSKKFPLLDTSQDLHSEFCKGSVMVWVVVPNIGFYLASETFSNQYIFSWPHQISPNPLIYSWVQLDWFALQADFSRFSLHLSFLQIGHSFLIQTSLNFYPGNSSSLAYLLEFYILGDLCDSAYSFSDGLLSYLRIWWYRRISGQIYSVGNRGRGFSWLKGH